MFAFLIGIILGVVYFGGLYLSVKNITKFKYPSLVMVVSLVLRMATLVLVFFYLSRGGFENMIFGLIGVILVRLIMILKMRNPKAKSSKKEGFDEH